MFKFFSNKTYQVFSGFQLEKPDCFIPWNVTQEGLVKLFANHKHDIKIVTNGYYTIECTSLNGLIHRLGFHFQPRESDYLKMLEFFRSSYPDLNESFKEFQQHFENSFGPPTKSFPRNSEGYPSYEWNLGKWRQQITIRHYVFDRFELEELCISKENDMRSHLFR
ncbi:hypothetical protein [Paenibacillus sp. Soil522]|uniref:hypothetical protein n=1 Tax=Paenibacillus sp. Soil522 TaxID=1736388 RepID=UPI0006FACA0C|nr:hypothetical protein [Paenibacillus sp. Soil522]KRE23290.1 hypothetical protein ASG81_28330 [Paenibacillus sp. Soil522]